MSSFLSVMEMIIGKKSFAIALSFEIVLIKITVDNV
jgi:hypothetical protein